MDGLIEFDAIDIGARQIYCKFMAKRHIGNIIAFLTSRYNLALVIVGLLFIIFPSNAGLALLTGFALSLLARSPNMYEKVHRTARTMLALAIIAYGFTISITAVGTITRAYFWLTISAIVLVLSVGWYLGRTLRVDALLAALIGSGTAICGASAIAAVGAATKASAEKITMALGTVLILNAFALVSFPWFGQQLQLSGVQFAAWAGLAIHDTSSVVGAALGYVGAPIDMATTVKLARAIWIAPITAFFAVQFGSKDFRAALRLPWFIWGYLVAATISTILPAVPELQQAITLVAKRGFILGIFLSGASVDLKILRHLGYRPFLLGVLLWLLSAGWNLFWLTQ